MKVNKTQVEEIMDLIHEWSDYDVSVIGYHDYEIVPIIPTNVMPDLITEVNKILKSQNKVWLKFKKLFRLWR
jgi:hypothetical protein